MEKGDSFLLVFAFNTLSEEEVGGLYWTKQLKTQSYRGKLELSLPWLCCLSVLPHEKG